jgi:hypothetical protein
MPTLLYVEDNEMNRDMLSRRQRRRAGRPRLNGGRIVSGAPLAGVVCKRQRRGRSALLSFRVN